MRRLAVISGLLALFGTAAAQTPVVSAGEHDGFSRIVFNGAGANVRVVQNDRTVRLYNLNLPAGYRFTEINDRRKAHRILSAKTAPGENGAVVELALNCDCEARASTLANGKFIVDIVGASAPKTASAKPAATPTPQAAANAPLTQEDLLSVEQAHNQMVELLKQAAREGLITIRDDIAEEKAAAEENAAPAAPTTFQTASAPTPAADTAKASGAPQNIVPPAASELAAAPTPVSAAGTPAQYACLSDDALAIDGAAFEADPLVQLSELQAQLGETEGGAEKEDIIRALTAGFLSIGFGDEALALLTDAGEEDSPFADVARAVAERPISQDGPLLAAENCRGAHALWQAVASAPQQAPALYNRSGGAVEALPLRLKRMIAGRLAAKMIEAQALDEAEALFAVASEGLETLSPELDYVRARLEKSRGNVEESRDALRQIAAGGDSAADDALLALADSYAQTGASPHEGFTEDIGALAKVGGSSEAALAEAMGWADVGNVDAALLLLQTVGERSPEDLALARRSAYDVIDDALSGGDANLALSALDAFLAHEDWIAPNRANTPVRRQLARAASEYGLPNLTFSLLDGVRSDGDKTLLQEKAAAALAAGDARTAIALAAPHAGEDDFAAVIVDANIREGQHFAALGAAAAITDANRKAAATARAAWLSRSWESALSGFNSLDPNLLTGRTALQYALAAYIANERALPAGAEAALSDNETIAAGMRAMFANIGQGSALERGRQRVEQTGREIRMFEEILSDG